MKLTVVNLLLIIPAAVFIVSCSSKKDDAGKGAAPAGRPKNIMADAYIVKPAAFSNSYSASGNLLPNEEVSLHPEVSGRITSINFREGSVVRKGQLLIQLYDGDLRANVQKLVAQRGLQQATANRQGELLKIGGIARQDYEATTTSIAATNADIAAANANLSRMRILAPFDGTIGLRGVSVGAVVSPTTVVASLQQLNPLKMDFAVPDQYRAQLRLGQDIRFSVDGLKDTITGKISAIEPGADMGTRTIKVRALVSNNNQLLTPGSFAHVVVPLEQNDAAIFVPSQSIIPTTRDKKVAVIRNGKAVMVTVQTGIRTADKTEITGGLNTGDTVMTTALMQVKPGMDVKVRTLMQ